MRHSADDFAGVAKTLNYAPPPPDYAYMHKRFISFIVYRLSSKSSGPRILIDQMRLSRAAHRADMHTQVKYKNPKAMAGRGHPRVI